MRESSNPVFRSLPKGQGGYAQFGTGAAGYGAQAVHADPYVTQYPDQQQAGVARPLTIDDVVTETGLTLAVLRLPRQSRISSSGRTSRLLMPLLIVGAIGGLVVLLIAIFGRKQDNPAHRVQLRRPRGFGRRRVHLPRRQLHGLRSVAGALIAQAVVGTLGVFFGMLVVYKTGAIRVTPKFTRLCSARCWALWCWWSSTSDRALRPHRQ